MYKKIKLKKLLYYYYYNYNFSIFFYLNAPFYINNDIFYII